MAKIKKTARKLKNINEKITCIKNNLITKNSKILTMGSCFAIEVRRYLQNKGYNMLLTMDNGSIWYNTYTIRYEFDKIDHEFTQDRPSDFWRINENRWQDPYRRAVFSNSYDGILKETRNIDKIMRNGIKNADVIIITLGLTEVWYQKHNNKVICLSPGYPRKEGPSGGQGCIFKQSNYDENYNNIVRVLEVLKIYNPKCKVIITVSPVPLAMTFTDKDHIVANTESKSILRSVAGQIERDYDNVYYFHSYELAMNHDKYEVFNPDARHVQPEFVEKIMKNFEEHFVS